MYNCLSECSPFTEEKNKEKIKGNENSTDTVQGREKKEDGSLPLFTMHDYITSCMVPSLYGSLILSCHLLPFWEENPYYLADWSLIPVEHENAGRTTACFEKWSTLLM